MLSPIIIHLIGACHRGQVDVIGHDGPSLWWPVLAAVTQTSVRPRTSRRSPRLAWWEYDSHIVIRRAGKVACSSGRGCVTVTSGRISNWCVLGAPHKCYANRQTHSHDRAQR